MFRVTKTQSSVAKSDQDDIESIIIKESSPTKSFRKTIASNQVKISEEISALNSEAKHILLHGIAGSGKTVELQKLINQHKEGQTLKEFNKILFLDFNLLSNNEWHNKYTNEQINHNFLACLIDYSSKYKSTIDTTTINKNSVNTLIKELSYPQRNNLIIADGYHDNDINHKIILEEVLTYKNILLATRSNSKHLKEKGFNLHLEQIGFDESDIFKYITMRLGENSNLIDFLRKQDSLRELIQIPKNLEILCKIWPHQQNHILQQEKITLTYLYDMMIYQLGKEYVEEFEHNLDADALSYEKIKSHPMLQFMREKAYNQLFNPSAKHISDQYQEKILQRTPPATHLTTAIEKFGLLEINFGKTLKDLDYLFHDNTIKEFMAADFLKFALINDDQNIVNEAKKSISLLSINLANLSVFKFLSGLIIYISNDISREQAKEKFWEYLLSNNEHVIKIHGNQNIELLIHLLSQTIGIDHKPNAPEQIINYVDNKILNNLNHWESKLIESQYISDKILSTLRLDDENTKLHAIRILPFLDTQNDSLIGFLNTEIKTNNDLLVIESCIDGLVHMSSKSGVKKILTDLIEDQRHFVQILAIEAIGVTRFDNSIQNLLSKLNSNNPYIVLATLNTLKHFKNHIDKEDITLKLTALLSYQGSQQNLIITKTIETLEVFKYRKHNIAELLINNLDSPSLYRSREAYISLKNILDENIVETLTKKLDSLRWGVNTQLKVNIITLISHGFCFLKEESQLEFYQRLLSKLTLKIPFQGNDIKIAAIDAVSNIFQTIPQDKHNEALEILLNKKGSDSKKAIIKNFSKISLSLEISLLPKLFNKMLEYLKEDEFKESVIEAIADSKIQSHIDELVSSHLSSNEYNIKFLGKIAHASQIGNINQILNILLQVLKDNSSFALKNSAIKSIYNIFSNIKNSEINLLSQELLLEIYTNFKNIHSEANILRIANSLAAKDEQNNISKKLEEEYLSFFVIQKLSNSILDEVLEASFQEWKEEITSNKIPVNIKAIMIETIACIIKKLPETEIEEFTRTILNMEENEDRNFYLSVTKILQQILFYNLASHLHSSMISFLGKTWEDEEIQNAQKFALIGLITALEAGTQNSILEFVINKYSSHSEDITLDEKNYLKKASQLLLVTALKSDSQVIHTHIQTFINNVGYDENFILESLENFLLEPIEHQLDILYNCKNLFYNYQIQSIIDAEINKIKNSLTPSICLTNADIFFASPSQHNLPNIAITPKGTVYINGNAVETKSPYAEAIYTKLKEANTFEYHTPSTKKTLKSIIDNFNLIENKIKISILKQGSDDPIFISEKLTSFGTVKIKKFGFFNGDFYSEEFERGPFFFSSEEVLGPPSESKKYRVSSQFITNEEYERFLKNFEESNIIPDDLFHHHRARTMSHNDMIGYSGNILRAIGNVSNKIDDVREEIHSNNLQIIEAFKDFSIKLEDLFKIINNINQMTTAPNGLSDEQTSMYITIVQQLMANYLMAVTMVYQDDSLISRASDFLDTISSFIPIAGPGLKFLGIITNSLSKIQQDKIIQNIAGIANTPSEMEYIAKNIALFFVQNKIDYNKIKDPQKITNLIKQILDNISIDSMVEKCVELCISSMEEEGKTEPEKFGEEKGQEIVNYILMPYISSAGMKNNIDGGQANLQNIKYYLISNNYITPISPTTTQDHNIVDLTPDTNHIKPLKKPLSVITTFPPDEDIPIPIPSRKRSSSYDELLKYSADKSSLLPKSFSDTNIAQITLDPKKSTIQAIDLEISLIKIIDPDNMEKGIKSPSTPTQNSPNCENYHGYIPTNTQIALTGAGLVSFAESIPSLKYLTKEYIPIKSYIDNLYNDLGLNSYYHHINSAIFITGAMAISCAAGSCASFVLPSITYIFKPCIYESRDQILYYIYHYQSGNSTLENGIKYILYVGTDVLITQITSQPFSWIENFNKYQAILGVGLGTLNYFNIEESSHSAETKNIAFFVTSLTAIKSIEDIKSLTELMIYFPIITNLMANVHYITSFVVDKIQNSFFSKEEINLSGNIANGLEE